MKIKVIRGLKYFAFAVVVIGLTLLAVRANDTRRFPSLEPWHTFVPDELRAAALDVADWNAYIQAEDRLFEAVRKNVTLKLPPKDQVPVNRYFEGSPIYPGKFATDWNRSYILEPAGKPAGVVVFLHGLTDSPYSLRHVARHYRNRGFVAVAIRLPAHGTVPAALSDVQWEDWVAATRLAVREARARVPAPAPLHLVGFSNGGALAMKFALDALEDDRLARPDRIVLISPMIGITRFARFAGLAGLPALLPPFAKAAWLSVVPEFNPFKYNSFPVNGARQSCSLTDALQSQIVRLSRAGRLQELPPVITFQSVMDFTVSTPAILSALYAHLPANGSEIVLFDVNRTVKFGPLLRQSSDTAVSRLLPSPPQRYRMTVIANASADSTDTVERMIVPGGTEERMRKLGLPYPPQIFSLSHVAIPFPLDDPLYGLTPDPAAKEQYGVSLGTMLARGERGALVVDQDFLSRIASNPFFPYMIERLDEGIRLPKSAPGIVARDVAPGRYDGPRPPRLMDPEPAPAVAP
jgi:alpha-beta hydrolase superfamily lysophospholipase